MGAGPVDVNPADVLECPFSPISDTKLSVYDCNPVFTGTNEDWGTGFTSVGFRTQNVLGHPFYQIWYASREDPGQLGNYGLGYAVSGDGTNWVTHTANPLVEEDGGWDKDNMDAMVVVWDEDRMEYVLAYQGYNLDRNTWGMGVMTSANGVDWSAHNGGDPVLDFTQTSQGINYCWPLGFSWEAGEGYRGLLGGSPPNRNVCQVYGFSGDDLTERFTTGDDVLLKAGPEPYDAAGMVSAATVKYGETWYLFYVGFEDWRPGNGYQSSLRHSLNLATSDDGENWEKHGDNPLPVALTRPGAVSDVAAQVVGSRIHLWVTDYYEDIEQSAVGYYLFEPDLPDHP